MLSTSELAEALEELLSLVSLLSGAHKTAGLRDAYIQANNTLDEWHSEQGVEEL